MAPVKSAAPAIARNRRARFDYFIEDTLEAGIILTGTEVKALRLGRASIGESYAGEEQGNLTLFNSHIPEYEPANRFNHAPRRPRQLLVHRKERDRLLGLVRRDGVTLVPLTLYFNHRGIAKLSLGVARGKRQHDKRQTEKDRDWNRQKSRIMREKG
jgi:SsrA-binding protein